MIELLKQKIAKIKDTATERSYYPLLCAFFEEYAKSNALKLRNPQATPEETSTQYEHRIGFPDITIRNGNDLIGWIEVKIPQENINAEKFQEQFSRYKESLENIIFTNLREWQLWQWEEGEAKKMADTSFDLTDINNASSEEFEGFLIKFFEGRAYQTRTPKQLALALAKKTRLLSQQVEEALDKSKEDSDLQKLKETFEKTLIQDVSEHQFANMVAETMAYSLFLAALEHSRRGNGTELTLTNAIDYLPTNVPILADLYGLVKKVASTIPTIYEATRLLVDQLNASEIERIHQKLVEHKPGEDPVIQFYEPFLKEYDPKEREARGVYYTPKPIVDYIVKSVDWILRNKFNKAKGLAEESVYLLDPATGTGTFLMSAIQEIHGNIKKENDSLGDEMVAREFNRVVLSHILKHFYGFELLIAPYAIAHLKLTLEVERLGFDFVNTKDDADKDNDRFKVYLANTLDDPNKPPAKLFGFDSIPQESESAREVKKNVPILAIVGNPPYSNFGRMNRGEWILNLLKDYKKGLKERKINIDDDFIKFIRFAQWKLEQTGQGIFAMITSNTFIDGITHRQMRRSLMDTFDEIYIYNLHGNSRKGEIAPDGGKDENVFNIQQGVSINIFVKFSEKQKETIVKYCDLWGLRGYKFQTLLEESGWGLNATQWKTLSPKDPNWFFVEKDTTVDEEYEKYEKLVEVFPYYNSAIQTKRDALTIQFDESKVQEVIEDFNKLSVKEIRAEYNLPADGRDWTIRTAKEDLRKNHPKIVDVLYRPFDIRKTIFTGKTKGFIAYPRTEIMLNFLDKDNLGLFTKRQMQGVSWSYISPTKNIAESAMHFSTPSNPHLFPLYIYNESSQSNLLGQENRQPNLSSEFIKTFSKKLGLEFDLNLQQRIQRENEESEHDEVAGRGKKYSSIRWDEYAHTKREGEQAVKSRPSDDYFGPEDIFYYAYAIFHSPTYRSRYAEQLKIDFPRLPLTGDKKLFAQLVRFGNKLVNLHLLGENPFDKSKTIFDEPEKWGIKIGGAKPENLTDWKVADVHYNEKDKRVYVNKGQYFEGVEKEVWEFMIGGYQVCEKWLKDRKKAERSLSTDDIKHYMKMVVAIRETIRLMADIDYTIRKWPIE
ncbi:MAG: hypothetical protein UX37_C0023G0015 [Microgenomates group bacterium GW2011_GWA2_46_16]|nr:MAG: hypothetical protein UX37_C0023G0015 [Microgenomates group bacterium GW2011_GWA2_46_16]